MEETGLTSAASFPTHSRFPGPARWTYPPKLGQALQKQHERRSNWPWHILHGPWHILHRVLQLQAAAKRSRRTCPDQVALAFSLSLHYL